MSSSRLGRVFLKYKKPILEWQKRVALKQSLCRTDIEHTDRTQITTPKYKRRKKSHSQESLWLPSVAPGVVDIPAGCLLPSQENQKGGREGKADGTTIVHRKLHRSQHHLPTTHPHAVSHTAHMLLHTKEAPERLTHTFSCRSARKHTHTHLKRWAYLRSLHPRNTHVHVCMGAAPISSSSVRTAEADRGEREREDEWSVPLLLSEGGGGPERGGWERGCVCWEEEK